MPKVRQKTLHGELARWQREVLLGGFPILSCFENWRAWRESPEAAAAWKTHGPELLKGCAGWRPRAWWRFTKKRKRPGPWWQEYSALKRMRELAAGEDAGFEAAHAELQPSQAPAGRDDTKYFYIEYRADGPALLAEHVAKNEFIAAWHKKRRRPQLAAKYEARAAALTRILEARRRGETPGRMPEPAAGGAIQ